MFLGGVCGLLSFFYLAFFLVSLVLGKTIDSLAFWAALIVFFGSLQLFSIGILGEYIGRILDEVKNRPLYNIENKKGF